MEPTMRKRLKPGELITLPLTLLQVNLITEHMLAAVIIRVKMAAP